MLEIQQWQFALEYLDDTVISYRSVAEHIDHVKNVLTPLRDKGATMKLEKGGYFTETFNYLGHIISRSRLGTA